MRYCNCPDCGSNFEFSNAFKDCHGWHTTCPNCDSNFGVDVENYIIPEGTTVKIPEGFTGVIVRCYPDKATMFSEIVYLIDGNKEGKDFSTFLTQKEFSVIENWKLLRRTEYGLERVCHYPANTERSSAPCYNCADRTKCNFDIFERLAQYEDTEIPPDALAEYKRLGFEVAKNRTTIRHLIDIVSAEREGRLVILPAKEVYELTWDAGPECDLSCPVSIGGHGCCDMCEKGKVFAYKRTCKQEHISEIGHNVFLTKEEAEAEAEKINAMYEEEERCTD